jgi:hypothetical protein
MTPFMSSGPILRDSFFVAWQGIAMFVPTLILAVVVFVLAWVVGAAVAKIVQRIISGLRVDSALRSAGFDQVLQKASIRLDSGYFFGQLAKWFIIIVGLMAALDLIGLSDVNYILRTTIIGYIPQVVKAVLILLLAVVLADVMRNVVVAAAKAARLSSANFLGAVTKWTIWIFGVLAALFQLNIAATFIQTLFTGVVVALALAAGLAFGLGGRDAAASYIEKLKKEISSKE